MNRLILIGNGFDLAHGLKTDYNSFVRWYLKQSLAATLANDNNHKYEDDLLSVECHFPGYKFGNPGAITNISDLVDHYFEHGLNHLFRDEKLYMKQGLSSYNPFGVSVKSKLFDELIKKCSHANWVDIENEFYDKLRELLDVEDARRSSLLKKLNNDLKAIISELEKYLLTIKCEKYSPEYSDIFNSNIKMEDIVRNNAERIKFNLVSDHHPNNTIILDFNYTGTVEKYLERNAHLPPPPSSVEVNYIHGAINSNENPMVFGFGDELDEDYKRMELSKINDFFEHIKSFWYFKTSNYHNLVRFIESDSYQIYILGHSCGLSDRTMLNMLFEHENCKSIKIYYHGDQQKNNYVQLTQEISRHFRDKVAMRRKIMPFDKSQPMPQVE